VTSTLNAVLDVTLWIGASVNRASGQQAQELKMGSAVYLCRVGQR
jgi:hypothetical protein